MRTEEVISLIKTAFPDAEILVDGEDCNFAVTVISPQFEGMSLLKKQQSVMATMKEQIASGELHAISVKSFTPSEWEARNS